MHSSKVNETFEVSITNRPRKKKKNTKRKGRKKEEKVWSFLRMIVEAAALFGSRDAATVQIYVEREHKGVTRNEFRDLDLNGGERTGSCRYSLIIYSKGITGSTNYNLYRGSNNITSTVRASDMAPYIRGKW